MIEENMPMTKRIETLEQRARQDNFLLNKFILSMVVAATLIEIEEHADAKEWLLNALEGYEGPWPEAEENLQEWYKENMRGIEWPRG